MTKLSNQQLYKLVSGSEPIEGWCGWPSGECCWNEALSSIPSLAQEVLELRAALKEIDLSSRHAPFKSLADNLNAMAQQALQDIPNDQ